MPRHQTQDARNVRPFVRAQEYDLDLDVEYPDGGFRGTVSLTASEMRGTVELDCEDLQVTGATLDGDDGAVHARYVPPQADPAAGRGGRASASNSICRSRLAQDPLGTLRLVLGRASRPHDNDGTDLVPPPPPVPRPTRPEGGVHAARDHRTRPDGDLEHGGGPNRDGRRPEAVGLCPEPPDGDLPPLPRDRTLRDRRAGRPRSPHHHRDAPGKGRPNQDPAVVGRPGRPRLRRGPTASPTHCRSSISWPFRTSGPAPWRTGGRSPSRRSGS